MKLEVWLDHLKKLAIENAELRIQNRWLLREVVSLKEELSYYQKEFARQNAKILTMTVQMQVDDA